MQCFSRSPSFALPLVLFGMESRFDWSCSVVLVVWVLLLVFRSYSASFPVSCFGVVKYCFLGVDIFLVSSPRVGVVVLDFL